MTRRLSNKDLTSGTVWKRLLLFFLPIAAGTCIQQLYNAVDGLIVGRFVGTVALAAVGGSSSQVINVLIGFFVAVTAGASVVIAQIYGAGRTEDVRIAAGNAIAVFALLGFLLMALGLVASPAMLRLMQTPEDTLPASILYLRIYFLGVPFILVLNMESNMLRSVGDSFSPFLFMVVGCISNIILDVVFVVFFHWGVAGVAIATVAAQIINMLMQWSSEYNLHIHTVLHLNKGDDNTRGHIGTELNNKAETVLQITKSQTDPNISEVKAMHIRDKEFEPFAFHINADSLPELVGDYEFDKKDSKRQSLTDLSEQEHREALSKVFANGDIPGYGNLIDALGEAYTSIGYSRGRNTLVALNKWLIANGYIVKKDKKYSLAQGVYKTE